jgi:uncharacterized membrane protein
MEGVGEGLVRGEYTCMYRFLRKQGSDIVIVVVVVVVVVAVVGSSSSSNSIVEY